MNIVEVFENPVIKAVEHKLQQSIEKLKGDELLLQKFRELADISRMLDRHIRNLKETFSNFDKEI